MSRRQRTTTSSHVRGIIANYNDDTGETRSTRKRHNAGDLEKDREEMLLRREANLRSMAAALENRVKETEAQANAPGGKASGLAGELDKDDMMLNDFLADEGITMGMDAGNDEESDEEVQELLDMLEGFEILAESSHQIIHKREEYRTRRDKTERQNAAWNTIMPEMKSAYLSFDLHGPPQGEEAEAPHFPPVKIFTLYNQSSIELEDTGEGLAVTLARHGYIATSPEIPRSAMCLLFLDLYRVASARCPALGVQAFTRAACDIQSVSYFPDLPRLFSQSFDVYMEILSRVSNELDTLIFKTPHEQFGYACPACIYKLNDEVDLEYSMLLCMDGNESVKRMRRVKKFGEGSTEKLEVIERYDERTRGAFFFLETSEVDTFAHEVKARAKKPASSQRSVKLTQQSIGEEGTPVDGVIGHNPCVDRWSNLSEDAKKTMWGVFEETGIFTAACRHGVVMAMCDMIRSGELAKYPLAITNRLIDVFGENLLIGYDIGCGFSETANNSKKVGPKVRESHCQFIVGAFHGHAHCRWCQVKWHPLYVSGSGLEDFEGCERIFSESNRIAACTRNASRFHRRQTILRHFERWNGDKYTEISKFIVNNYKQALEQSRTLTVSLAKAKEALNIESDNIFATWLSEEYEFLSQNSEPISATEIMAMDYVRILKDLDNATNAYHASSAIWLSTPIEVVEKNNFYRHDTQQTNSREVMAARGLDSVLTLQKAARDYEMKLGISARWTSNTPQYMAASKSIAERVYNSSVDKLEALIISRMFELSKMNQAGTGYKLRTQIANGLKRRSKAIKTAVDEYNDSASKLDGSIKKLEIKDVLEYVFLGEFDLLRSTRRQIVGKPWARRAERETMNLYFKCLRAEEEVRRLNIEARRLITFIHDFHKTMSKTLSELSQSNAKLAHQLRKRVQLRKQQDLKHLNRLRQLNRLDGFTGSFIVGTHKGTGHAENENDETLETIAGALGRQETSCSDNDNNRGERHNDDDDDDDDDGVGISERVDTTLAVVFRDV